MRPNLEPAAAHPSEPEPVSAPADVLPEVPADDLPALGPVHAVGPIRRLPVVPAYARIWERRLDVILLVSLTVLALALRLWQLDSLPQGVHGDEAQFGMDAQRVLDSGWIGPYTTSALGQPSGIAYVAAPGQALFGNTALGVRFSMAVFAAAAVPLAYVLFRLLGSRPIAVIAAFLLATSLWHIHLSRVAYQPSLVPTIELTVLVLWTLALQRGQWYWFAAAGAVLGLGLYTYNVYPIFVVAFTLWVLVYTALFKRRDLAAWSSNVALAVAAAVVVALPLFLYIAQNRDDYFQHYRSYYDQYSVLASQPYKAAGTGEKLEIIRRQAKRFVGAYVSTGITDFVDGSSPDRRPMFDKLTVVLLAAGIGLALWRWRDTPNLLSLMLVGIIPLTTVLQTNSIYRGPLGAAPFVCFLIALPLGLAWRNALLVRHSQRRVVYGVVGVLVAAIAYMNVHTYFGPWAGSQTFPWVYAQQISAASTYATAQPNEPYVYFLSGRWTINYETRQYLAPDLKGEDRSKEFGRSQRLDDIDRSRDALVLLLPPYENRVEELEARYPEGTEHLVRDGNDLLFVAYHVPARSTSSTSLP